MTVKRYVSIPGIGACGEILEARVERTSVLGTVITVQGVPLNRREWEQFKEETDALYEEVKGESL